MASPAANLNVLPGCVCSVHLAGRIRQGPAAQFHPREHAPPQLPLEPYRLADANRCAPSRLTFGPRICNGAGPRPREHTASKVAPKEPRRRLPMSRLLQAHILFLNILPFFACLCSTCPAGAAVDSASKKCKCDAALNLNPDPVDFPPYGFYCTVSWEKAFHPICPSRIFPGWPRFSPCCRRCI